MSWERAQLAAARRRPDCEVRLDRLGVTASGISEGLVLAIPGFRRERKHLVRPKHPREFRAYGRMTKFTSTSSVRQMTALTERRLPTIAECKVTMIARDETGLQPKDAFAVLELLPDVKLVMVELAFDFGSSSGVDGAYVRKHALFGKSRRNQISAHRCYDTWGTRRGAKFIRSYYKGEIGVHRVELQLNRRFLRRHGIKDVFDFHRLVEVLPVRHLLLAKLDEGRVRQQLKNAGHTVSECRRIMERVRESEGDLLAQFGVSRKRGGLRNVRRLLVPMEANELVGKALRRWARQWPKSPNRLRRSN